MRGRRHSKNKRKKKKQGTSGAPPPGCPRPRGERCSGRPSGPCGTHQRDDGALGGELRGAEQRPDEAVDLLLLGVVLVVIGGDLRLLQQREAKSVGYKSVNESDGANCCRVDIWK